MSIDNCPHCKANLIGDPIPQEYIDKGWYGDSTHWRREIGVEVRGVYDGVAYWQCPDCGGKWHRFPKGNSIHGQVDHIVNREGWD